MTRRMALAWLALALALPFPAFAHGGANLRAEIGKMSQAWEKAYNAGDAAGVTALYTRDATVMPPVPNRPTAPARSRRCSRRPRSRAPGTR
jgi:hypothetical protein